MEIVDPFSISLQNLSLRLHQCLFIVSVFLFLTFYAHDTHEVVSWVAELWTSKINGCEVVHREPRFIEKYDSSLSQKH